MRDSIIIGSGPAGISAALYLNNLNKDVLVIGKDYGQLTKNDIIDNFYGQFPINGQDLIKKGIDQAKNLGIPVIMDSVLNVVKVDDYFIVTTIKETFEAKTVVLTTGKPRLPLSVPGYRIFKGKGIHLCATCDGFFYRKKKVAIVGSGPYMEQELSVLENYTDDITIFSENVLYEHPKYKVITERIKSFSGDKRLSHIHTKENTYETQGVFVAIGFPTASELALKLGVITEHTNILVDEHMETNIEGIFAGGDCIGGKLQIAKAIHDGLKISSGVNTYLKKLKQ